MAADPKSGAPRTRKPGFQKGDPNINRKGRPKAFDTVRKMAQTIAEETATDSEGKPISFNGRNLTVLEFVLRSLATSPSYKARSMFIEFAYGKIPETIHIHEHDENVLSDAERAEKLAAILDAARARRA